MTPPDDLDVAGSAVVDGYVHPDYKMAVHRVIKRCRRAESELAEMNNSRLAAEQPLVEMLGRLYRWRPYLIDADYERSTREKDFNDAEALLAQRRQECSR